MVESFIYTPKTVTSVAPHARSYVDMKRIMTYVVIATIPCILWGMWNTGYQANSAIAALGPDAATGWRIALLQMFGISLDPSSIFANVMHGLLYFLPIYIVTLVAGGIFEVIFATVRGHEVNEGFSCNINALYADHASNSTPLWQVALGHHLRGRDRQRGVRGHRQELPQPRAGGAGIPVFRLSGADVRRLQSGHQSTAFQARPRLGSFGSRGRSGAGGRRHYVVQCLLRHHSGQLSAKPRRWPVSSVWPSCC